jgi:protein involved in polysaccharide export with SLBB domain
MSHHEASIITVKVARVGFPVTEVALTSGSTVSQALSAAGQSVESGQSVYFQGRRVEQSETLTSNGLLTIMAVEKVKGA